MAFYIESILFLKQQYSLSCKVSTCLLDRIRVEFNFKKLFSSFFIENYGFKFMFFHDNASFQTSNETKNWFEKQNISLLDHPPSSADLNPMKNAWPELV